MSKIITIPLSLEEINNTKTIVDGYIIGIKDMSVNTNYCIDDLSILNDITNKEIFISLNKNMHNSDLDEIKRILIELNNYNIKGVLYYDVAVLNIYNNLNLNYDLVWAQEHASTNYNTINYWHDMGAKYTYLSSDITIDEVKNIIDNTKSKLMINLFGYLPMFVSKRHIVNNYLDYFKKEDNSKINYIEKENKIYPIIDNSIGTYAYSNNILNGIKYSLDLDIEYIILNSFNIKLESIKKVIKMFKEVNKNNILEYDKEINNMFSNVDNGFLETKTIYKVKHEK